MSAGLRQEFVSKGEKNNAQALAASKSNQVASFSFLGVRHEAGHFDREEEGGCASNANDLNCSGECAVGCEKSREGRDKRDNGREGGASFKFKDKWRVVLDENGEVGNAVRLGRLGSSPRRDASQ